MRTRYGSGYTNQMSHISTDNAQDLRQHRSAQTSTQAWRAASAFLAAKNYSATRLAWVCYSRPAAICGLSKWINHQTHTLLYNHCQNSEKVPRAFSTAFLRKGCKCSLPFLYGRIWWLVDRRHTFYLSISYFPSRCVIWIQEVRFRVVSFWGRGKSQGFKSLCIYEIFTLCMF